VGVTKLEGTLKGGIRTIRKGRGQFKQAANLPVQEDSKLWEYTGAYKTAKGDKNDEAARGGKKTKPLKTRPQVPLTGGAGGQSQVLEKG